MNAVFESGNLELIEKYHHQEDVLRVRRRCAKQARAAKYFKRQAAKVSKMQNAKENPTETEERALKKTSLSRSLPAASKVVQAPLLRQLHEDSDNGNGTLPTAETIIFEAPDLSVEILQSFAAVSRKLHAGEDLGPLKEEIVKMLYGLNEKIALSEGIMALCQSHRLCSLVQAQAKVTGYLILCAQRNDLTPTESLAFFKLFGDEIDSIRKMLDDFDGSQLRDVEGLLNSADLTVLQKGKELRERFKGTSPQGRDIIRKVGHTMLEVAKEKQQRELAEKADDPTDTEHTQDAATVAGDSQSKDQEEPREMEEFLSPTVAIVPISQPDRSEKRERVFIA